ncbi:MAG: hypothetical protein AB4290_15950 [Spirulina sp.]
MTTSEAPNSETPTTPETEAPEPTVTPDLIEPKFGFNDYAERLNGRAAMIGFFLAILIEVLTGQGLLAWLGLQ